MSNAGLIASAWKPTNCMRRVCLQLLSFAQTHTRTQASRI